MKLFGTIVYPKNRYLTLQFSKGGKNVTCDDYFENMVGIFSCAAAPFHFNCYYLFVAHILRCNVTIRLCKNS